MKTKLHRLYKRKLAPRWAAQNVVDEPELKSQPQPDGHDELSVPNKFPQGEEPDNPNGFPEMDYGKMRKIEGLSKNSGMIAIYPTDYAAKEIRDYFKRLPGVENKRDLHITLVYLGKELTDEEWDMAESVCDHVADAHEPMWCKTQGIGLFDHDDDGRPFYCGVDAVGMADLRVDLVSGLESRGIKVPKDYDFTPHLTIAYLADPDVINLDKGSPGVRWECNEICLVRGDEVIHTSTLGIPNKQAGGFGFSLHELSAPSKGQGFIDNPADNHKDENTNEDVDLKLGAPMDMGMKLELTQRLEVPDPTVTPLSAWEGKASADSMNLYLGKEPIRWTLSVARNPGGGRIARLYFKIGAKSYTQPTLVAQSVTNDKSPAIQVGQNFLDQEAGPAVAAFMPKAYEQLKAYEASRKMNAPPPVSAAVEAPYSEGQGPLNVRFDDDKKFDITKGADEHSAIGLPDPEPNSDVYGEDFGRADRAIPRPPATRKLIYRSLSAPNKK